MPQPPARTCLAGSRAAGAFAAGWAGRPAAGGSIGSLRHNSQGGRPLA